MAWRGLEDLMAGITFSKENENFVRVVAFAFRVVRDVQPPRTSATPSIASPHPDHRAGAYLSIRFGF